MSEKRDAENRDVVQDTAVMPASSDDAASKPKRKMPLGKPFAKGQSGNPTGKGRLDHEIRQMARDACPMALERLVHWAGSSDPKASVAASRELLDRGLGKAAATLTVTDERDPLGLAMVREAAAQVLANPEARMALRLALRGEAGQTLPEVAPGLPSPAEAKPGALPEVFQSGTETPATLATPDWFVDLLSKYRRVCIAGGPQTGKTTLAMANIDHLVFHTDDYIPHGGWDAQPEIIQRELDAVCPRPWLLEGVQVGRCLRKGLVADVVVWLDQPRVTLTPEQSAMAQGCRTIFRDVVDQWSADARGAPMVLAPEAGITVYFITKEPNL